MFENREEHLLKFPKVILIGILMDFHVFFYYSNYLIAVLQLSVIPEKII